MTVFLFFIGSALIGVGAYQFKYYQTARRWTTRRLMHIRLNLKETRKIDGNYVWDMYIPQATYEYKVSNEKYIGHVISKDETCIQFLTKEEAKTFVERLNNQHCVYINPKDPADAVLINTISKKQKSHIAAFIVSGALLIISSFILGNLIA